MARFQQHLRNTFLAGIFAAIPIAVTAFVLYYAETTTRSLFHVPVPFLGIVIAVAGIYLLGLGVSSLVGKYLLRQIDRLLLRLPVLKEVYQAWKQISLTPGGREGTFAKVVLIPVETGKTHALGFTSGEGVEGDPQSLCVFVPGLPNPIVGRLYFVKRADCFFPDLSIEEAFKILLSSGNYIPPAIGRALAGGRSLSQDKDGMD
jgi:uncharacterized membrane protein